MSVERRMSNHGGPTAIEHGKGSILLGRPGKCAGSAKASATSRTIADQSGS